MFTSAYSSTSDNGRVDELTPRYRTGEWAGFTLRNVGRAAEGSEASPAGEQSAACTSSPRHRCCASGGTRRVMGLVAPMVLLELIDEMPCNDVNSRSEGLPQYSPSSPGSLRLIYTHRDRWEINCRWRRHRQTEVRNDPEESCLMAAWRRVGDGSPYEEFGEVHRKLLEIDSSRACAFLVPAIRCDRHLGSGPDSKLYYHNHLFAGINALIDHSKVSPTASALNRTLLRGGVRLNNEDVIALLRDLDHSRWNHSFHLRREDGRLHSRTAQARDACLYSGIAPSTGWSPNSCINTVVQKVEDAFGGGSPSSFWGIACRSVCPQRNSGGVPSGIAPVPKTSHTQV